VCRQLLLKETVGALTGLGCKTPQLFGSELVPVFSFIGYVIIEEQVSARTTVNAALSPATTELESIVTGYGTQKKHLTGSVVKYRKKKLFCQ
jgi:hypothetical protein